MEVYEIVQHNMDTEKRALSILSSKSGDRTLQHSGRTICAAVARMDDRGLTVIQNAMLA
jgi:hypothetical protein